MASPYYQIILKTLKHWYTYLNLCRILQHVVNGFDNVSLAQHHSVIERHQLVFHVYAQPCHQLYSILKEEVKQLL